jgi:hypothetical protein
MKADNLSFKVSESKTAIQESLRPYNWARTRSILYALCQFAVILVIFSLPMGYFHVGYKRLAMAIALRGVPYKDRDVARAYLQTLAQKNIAVGANQEQFVDAFITWLNSNMKLQERLVNHPNPVYLIEHGGICGQFATATVKILRANGYEARQVLLNWDGKGTAHVIIEVKLNGQWTAFDPLGFGGGAYPQETFVSHIRDGENTLNALDLYHHAELLPSKNTFNLNFFAQGEAIKVETASGYSEFSVQPDFLYGRDWPTVKTTETKSSSWVYQDSPSKRLQDMEAWSVLPYFSRLTFWFGTNPIVLHFEYPVIVLLFFTFGFVRIRQRFSRVWRLRLAGVLSLGFLTYSIMITIIWINRYYF